MRTSHLVDRGIFRFDVGDPPDRPGIVFHRVLLPSRATKKLPSAKSYTAVVKA